jgi:hypothetical protein
MNSLPCETVCYSPLMLHLVQPLLLQITDDKFDFRGDRSQFALQVLFKSALRIPGFLPPPLTTLQPPFCGPVCKCVTNTPNLDSHCTKQQCETKITGPLLGKTNEKQKGYLKIQKQVAKNLRTTGHRVRISALYFHYETYEAPSPVIRKGNRLHHRRG